MPATRRPSPVVDAASRVRDVRDCPTRRSTTLIDSPAAVSDTDDRVLLQFAATVPHDLAELRRIAADNQW